MAFGILEDKHMSMPPGTSRLNDKFSDDPLKPSGDTSKLKKRGDIILVPQPSDDPNDPLNWSPAWKNTITAMLGVLVAVTISLGPMVVPGLPLLAAKYHKTLDQVSSVMLGTFQLVTGAFMVFIAAGATIWGKRIFFVIGTVFLCLTCGWAFFVRSFDSLTAMRVIQGIGAAPIETLIIPAVADLYFVHERGTHLAIWHMMIGAGIGLGQIISGFVIKYLGIEATFGISGLILVILTAGVYFLMPETTYNRKEVDVKDEQSAKENRASISSDRTIVDSEKELAKEKTLDIETTVSDASEQGEIHPPKKTYRQQLSIFNGKFSDQPYWKLWLKPLPLLGYPAVLFSTVVSGFHIAALVTMGLLGVVVLQAPPYNLDPAQLGLLNIPHIVVSSIFSPLSGWLADYIPRKLAKRNDGIFEPEYRLWLMVIAVPITTAAFVGFGIAVDMRASLPWILFFSTLQAVAVPFASQAALTYVLDCHPRDTNSAFVSIHLAKTLYVFAATSTVSGWYEKSGAKSVFITLAIVNALVSGLTIPMYIFGKRFRSAVARSRFAKKIEQS